MLNVNGKSVKQQGYITDELTEYALEFLSERRNKPFFLYLSHKAVHASFEPAQRHQNQYADAQISLGRAPAAHADVPMWVRNQQNSWHGDEFPYHSALPLAEFKREYHRTLSAVDDSVGKLVTWLRENHQLENTVVILMGDNGFMFGEHGLIDKRNAYEESMRVPLLLMAPGLYAKGQVVDEMVANIDIAPTLLSLAGASLPDHYDGMSFAQLPDRVCNKCPKGFGKASSTAWRDSLSYEYYWEYNYPMTPTVFALRTERFKLIQYHGVWDTEELFDLQADPKETTNLIEHPDYLETKVEMRKALYASLASQSGEHTIPYSQKVNQGAVFRHKDRSQAAEFPDKWLRQDKAPDRWEHILPDGVEKADRLKVVNEVLKDR